MKERKRRLSNPRSSAIRNSEDLELRPTNPRLVSVGLSETSKVFCVRCPGEDTPAHPAAHQGLPSPGLWGRVWPQWTWSEKTTSDVCKECCVSGDMRDSLPRGQTLEGLGPGQMGQEDAPRGTPCLFFAASHRRAQNLINKNLMSERI